MATAGDRYALLEAEQDKMPVSWLTLKGKLQETAGRKMSRLAELTSFKSGDTKLWPTDTHMYTAKLVWPVVWLVEMTGWRPEDVCELSEDTTMHQHYNTCESSYNTVKDVCYLVVHVQCVQHLTCWLQINSIWVLCECLLVATSDCLWHQSRLWTQ